MTPPAAAAAKSRMNALMIEGYHALRKLWRRLLFAVSPVLFARYRFFCKMGRGPDLRRPRSFKEKLLWLMVYWRHPLKTRCADKYEMRGFVREQGLERLLPDLLGVYRNSREIDFDALPERFVLKCSHGCGFNIFCPDKSRLDRETARRKLDAWMKRDFSKEYGELHYAGMKPTIICEPFLDGEGGGLPRDYKVYCFRGTATCTMVCAERSEDSVRALYYYYDRDWAHRLPFDKTTASASDEIPQPAGYMDMIEAAERLSRPFPFVRIDFYSIQGRAVLGEMTFTPAGCLDMDMTEEGDRILGEMIELPPKRLK